MVSIPAKVFVDRAEDAAPLFHTSVRLIDNSTTVIGPGSYVHEQSTISTRGGQSETSHELFDGSNGYD